MPIDIPEVVIDRLPVYVRALKLLERDGCEVVSSYELGEQLGVTPAQIRKDLSYFGRFGKQGRGYNVHRLLSELRQILGLEQQWTVALIGVGNLGRAILTYGGFAPEGFYIVEAFDASPEIVGQRVGHVLVRDVKDLPEFLRRSPIDIGIVAVPATAAQEVIDTLVSSGTKAVLNYAPIAARARGDIRMRYIDPVLALQSMTFYMKGQKKRAK